MLLQFELRGNASDAVLKKTIFLHPLFGALAGKLRAPPPAGLRIGQPAQEAF
jgi:hypothetical protein